MCIHIYIYYLYIYISIYIYPIYLSSSVSVLPSTKSTISIFQPEDLQIDLTAVSPDPGSPSVAARRP